MSNHRTPEQSRQLKAFVRAQLASGVRPIIAIQRAKERFAPRAAAASTTAPSAAFGGFSARDLASFEDQPVRQAPTFRPQPRPVVTAPSIPRPTTTASFDEEGGAFPGAVRQDVSPSPIQQPTQQVIQLRLREEVGDLTRPRGQPTQVIQTGAGLQNFGRLTPEQQAFLRSGGQQTSQPPESVAIQGRRVNAGVGEVQAFVSELQAQGVPPEEALRQARIRFGDESPFLDPQFSDRFEFEGGGSVAIPPRLKSTLQGKIADPSRSQIAAAGFKIPNPQQLRRLSADERAGLRDFIVSEPGKGGLGVSAAAFEEELRKASPARRRPAGKTQRIQTAPRRI